MNSVKPKLPKQILPKGGVDKAGMCFRCGKPVAIEKGAVLEEDGRIAEWHDFGMPEDVSMGPVLFGSNCAASMRKRARFELETDASTDEPKAAYLTRMKSILERLALESQVTGDKIQGMHEHHTYMLKVIEWQIHTGSGHRKAPLG